MPLRLIGCQSTLGLSGGHFETIELALRLFGQELQSVFENYFLWEYVRAKNQIERKADEDLKRNIHANDFHKYGGGGQGRIIL